MVTVNKTGLRSYCSPVVFSHPQWCGLSIQMVTSLLCELWSTCVHCDCHATSLHVLASLPPHWTSCHALSVGPHNSTSSSFGSQQVTEESRPGVPVGNSVCPLPRHGSSSVSTTEPDTPESSSVCDVCAGASLLHWWCTLSDHSTAWGAWSQTYSSLMECTAEI